MIRVVLLALCLCACGNAQGSSSANETSSGACWPVAPMRLVTEKELVAEITGDGSIYSHRGNERKFLGRIANDSVLDAHETPSFTCIHKQVDAVGGGFKGKYDEHDAFVAEGLKIVISDDGTATLDHRMFGHRMLGNVEGVSAHTRRTAALFMVMVLDEHGD